MPIWRPASCDAAELVSLSLPLSDMTVSDQRTCLEEGNEPQTFVHVLLRSQLIVRVAVGIDRAIKLLESHQCSDKLVVSMKKTAEPLFRFYVLNLKSLLTCYNVVPGKAYIAQNLPAQ